VKTVSDRAVAHSSGLYICAKMIGGGCPLLHENLAITYPPACTTPIFNLFSLVAHQP